MRNEEPMREWVEGLDDRERDTFHANLHEVNERRGKSAPEKAAALTALTELAERREPLGELYLDQFIEHSRDSGIVASLKLEIVETVAGAHQEDPFGFREREGGDRLDALVSEVTARFRDGLKGGFAGSPSGRTLERFLTSGNELPEFHERLEQAVAEQPPPPEWVEAMQERLREFSLHAFGNKLTLETSVEVAQRDPSDVFSDSEIAAAIDQATDQGGAAMGQPQVRGILLRLAEAGLVVRVKDEPDASDPRSLYYRRAAHPYWSAVTEIGRGESERFYAGRLGRRES
ncbi:MAG: hypothetical protein M3N59_02400 [bacterium]|nr:hypothetical protein [bacterium]